MSVINVIPYRAFRVGNAMFMPKNLCCHRVGG
jgi:hypothetical protein